MNTETQEVTGAVTTANALKMAIEFIDEITNAAGKYPYVNKTSLVVDSYAMASKLKEALSQPSQEVECSNHPDAPHGFCRDASHSAGRYVCECEGWEAEQPAQEPVAWATEWEDGEWSVSHSPNIGKQSIPLYTHPAPLQNEFARTKSCQECENLKHDLDGYMEANKELINREWQGLSDDEIFNLCTYIDHDLLEEAFYRGARAAEQELKRKNGF